MLLTAPLGPSLARREASLVAAAARAGVRHVVKLSGPEVAERLGRPLGRAVRYVDMPPEAAAGALRAQGTGERLVGAPLEVMARVRADAPAAVGDHVERVCGRRPRSIEDFAGESAEVFGAPATSTVGR